MPTPADGFGPMASTQGRVNSALVAESLTSDMVSAVNVAAAVTAVNEEVTAWKVADEVQGGSVTTLESPTAAPTSPMHAGRQVYSVPLKGGTGKQTVTLEILNNQDPRAGKASLARFPAGRFIKFDLVYHKQSKFGHYGCVGRVVGHPRDGGGITGDPQKATVTIDVAGCIPDPTWPA